LQSPPRPNQNQADEQLRKGHAHNARQYEPKRQKESKPKKNQYIRFKPKRKVSTNSDPQTNRDPAEQMSPLRQKLRLKSLKCAHLSLASALSISPTTPVMFH
jgi:hypothetical protein